MKRDECGRALHEIAMRRALCRSKCYPVNSDSHLVFAPSGGHGPQEERAQRNAVRCRDAITEANGGVQVARGRRRAGNSARGRRRSPACTYDVC